MLEDDLKSILRDYKFIKDRANWGEEEEEIVELFSHFPRSVDHADDIAKLIIVRALEVADFQESLTKDFGVESDISEEQRVAWGLMVALSQEIRQVRFNNRKKVEEAAEDAKKEAEKAMMRPTSIANYLRLFSSSLDGNGKNQEAIVLRDAADILETDF